MANAGPNTYVFVKHVMVVNPTLTLLQQRFPILHHDCGDFVGAIYLLNSLMAYEGFQLARWQTRGVRRNTRRHGHCLKD